MDQPLTAEHFRPYVGTVFRLQGGRHELTLSAVNAHNVDDNAAALAYRQPFTLIFSGPPRDVLPEGMRTFEVADGAQFELYVIPVLTQSAARQDYQAVFN